MEKESASLYREVADHEETIEAMQTQIQIMQTDHSRQVLEMQQQHRKEMEQKDTDHKKEVLGLRTVISKAVLWFLYLREMIRRRTFVALSDLMKGRPQHS